VGLQVARGLGASGPQSSVRLSPFFWGRRSPPPWHRRSIAADAHADAADAHAADAHADADADANADADADLCKLQWARNEM
jgi:hypothetical protein